MHSRRETWVRGHYRNGNWIEGHYRCGTIVADYEKHSKYAPTFKSSVPPWLVYGSITISTKCFWCEDTVFFHRDKNGGCVLLDAIGHPWPVHPCWEEQNEERDVATARILENHAKHIIENKKLRNTQSSNIPHREFTVLGYIELHHPSRRVELLGGKKRSLVDIRIITGKDSYNILVEDATAEKLIDSSVVRIICKTGRRGNGTVIFAECIETLPIRTAGETHKSRLNLEDILSSRWLLTRLMGMNDTSSRNLKKNVSRKRISTKQIRKKNKGGNCMNSREITNKSSLNQAMKVALEKAFREKTT